MADRPTCKLCGHPMPEGEEMFAYHGYSGPCPTDASVSWLRERLRMFTDRLASCSGPEEYTATLTNEVRVIEQRFAPTSDTEDVGEEDARRMVTRVLEEAIVDDRSRSSRERALDFPLRFYVDRIFNILARLRRTPETEALQVTTELIRTEWPPTPQLAPNNERFDAVYESVKAGDPIREPILVRYDNWTVIDGHHRINVARLLGLPTVPVLFWTGTAWLPRPPALATQDLNAGGEDD